MFAVVENYRAYLFPIRKYNDVSNILLNTGSCQRRTIQNIHIYQRNFSEKTLHINTCPLRYNFKGKKQVLMKVRRYFSDKGSIDCCVILGVPPTASKKEIREAYLKLAKKYHPDANPGNPNAKQHFQEIADAYNALCDDNTRHPLKPYYKAKTNRHYKETNKRNQESTENEFSNFTLPRNVRLRDVLKQIFIDMGREQFIDNIEKVNDEALAAFKTVRQGDWVLVKKFASEHIGMVASFLGLVVMFLCFPWMINVIIYLLWYVYYSVLLALFILIILGRSSIFVSWIVSPLHLKFMSKAQKAEARKKAKQ